jgi:hypothetical protein
MNQFSGHMVDLELTSSVNYIETRRDCEHYSYSLTAIIVFGCTLSKVVTEVPEYLDNVNTP